MTPRPSAEEPWSRGAEEHDGCRRGSLPLCTSAPLLLGSMQAEHHGPERARHV